MHSNKSITIIIYFNYILKFTPQFFSLHSLEIIGILQSHFFGTLYYVHPFGNPPLDNPRVSARSLFNLLLHYLTTLISFRFFIENIFIGYRRMFSLSVKGIFYCPFVNTCLLPDRTSN